LLLAAGTGWLEQRLKWVRRNIATIHLVSGILLVAFGALLALGWIGQISSRLSGVPGLDI